MSDVDELIEVSMKSLTVALTSVNEKLKIARAALIIALTHAEDYNGSMKGDWMRRHEQLEEVCKSALKATALKATALKADGEK